MKIITIIILMVSFNFALFCQTETTLFENYVITLPNNFEKPSGNSDTCQSCLIPYGKKFKINVNINEWCQTITDSCKIYSLEITAKGALFLDINFKNFQIQEGCILRLYSSENEFQEYHSLYNKDNGLNKAISVEGGNILLKYFTSDSIILNNDIKISSILYVYRIPDENLSQLKSLTCQHDVNCPEGDPYREIIRSVVEIRKLCENNGDCYICSGVLLNNTNDDYAPYILTAHHCTQGREDNLDETEFCFNWQNILCNGTSPYSYYSNPYVLTGAELKAQRTLVMGSDFALLKLSETPPLQYNVYYAGWSREWGLTGSDAVGIHHPGGDSKKISFGHVQGISAGDYINVKWDDGTVEGGSSGSPIFKNKQVVGQLYGGGGNTSCDNLGDDLYGHFASSWGSTWGPDRRLRDWLNPSESNPDSWNGADPRVVCTPDLYLSGVYPRTDYQSESVVIQATNTINISNMDVQDNGNYIFKAGNSIHITAGTTLHSGTYKIEDSPCPLSVGISGPSKGNNSSIYTWTAHVSNGTQPYFYEWSYSYDDNNYTEFMGNTSSITTPLPIDMDLYLKVTVSSSDGQTASDYFLTINMDAHTNKSINPNDTLSESINDTLKKNISKHNKIIFTSNLISILPNPTSGILAVSYNQNIPFIVEVTNTIGKNIYCSEFSTGSVIIDLTNQPKGLYFIKVSNANSLLKVDKIIYQ